LPGPYGSGDFGAAAYHFIDWLVAAGQKMWQILPWVTSAPQLSLYEQLGICGKLSADRSERIERAGWLAAEELIPHEDFNHHKVNYDLVHQYRMARLRLAAQRFFADQQHHRSEF